MGAAVSSNVTKNIQKTLTKISQKQVMQAVAKSSGSNIINWKAGGDVVIRGNIDQRNTATVNVKQVANAMTNANVQTQLGAMLKQQAVAMNQDFNIFQVSVASNMTENYQGVTNNISSDIEQLCSSSSDQENVFNVKTTGGIDFQEGASIVQENQSDLVANCAQKAVSQSEALTKIQAKISQAASAVNKGVDITKLFMYVVIGLVVVLIAVPVTFGSVFKTLFKKDMIVILLTLGGIGACIGCYFGNVLGTTENKTLMNNYTYTKMCAGAKPYDKTEQAGSVDVAVQGCQNDEKCKGVYFGPKENGKPGESVTIRYSSVPNGCLPTYSIPDDTRSACGKCNKADQLWTGTRKYIFPREIPEEMCYKMKKNDDCNLAKCDPAKFKPSAEHPHMIYSHEAGHKINVPSWDNNCGKCGQGEILDIEWVNDPKAEKNGIPQGTCTLTYACDMCSLSEADVKQCTLCSTGLAHMTCTTAVRDANSVGDDPCVKPNDGTTCKGDDCYDSKLKKGDAVISATSIKGKENVIWHRNYIWFVFAGGVLVIGCALLFLTQPKSNRK